MFKKLFKHIRHGTIFIVLKEVIEASRNERKIQQDLEKVIFLPNQNVSRAAKDIIYKYFRYPLSIEKGLSKEYIKTITGFIVSRRRGILLPEDHYNDLIKQTEALKSARLSSYDWKKICFLSMCNGLFRLSAVYRKKAIDNTYQKATSNPACLEWLYEAFKAAVDQGDFDKAEETIDQINWLTGKKTFSEKLYIYFNLMNGERHKARPLAEAYFTNIDRAYAEYLEGKKVAVVGPAPSGEDLADEIDSYDVVIRFNYRGGITMANSKEFGSKADVSYYNNEAANIMSKLGRKFLFGDLDFAVFKDIKYSFQKEWYNVNRGRTLFSADDFLFTGSANITPLALYDLLFFKASKIKLFKVNFYLSANTYYEGYKHEQGKTKNNNYTRLWYGFAVHNPLTQLFFTRNLWQSEQIEVDKTCKAVLSLSSEGYMSKMEEIYVKQPVKSNKIR